MSQKSHNQKRNLWERIISFANPSVVTDYTPPARQVASNLWVLDRQLRLPGGLVLPTCCTIIRLSSGELFLHSPCELNTATRESLEALGQVRFIVAPNSFHYLYAPSYLTNFTDSTFYLAPGLAERKPELPTGETLSDDAPAAWASEIDQAVFGPTSGLSEVAFFHQESQTVLLTDFVFYMPHAPSKSIRFVWDMLGIPRSFGPSRTARLMLLRDRELVGNFVRRLLEWPFERIIVTHGEVLDSGGREAMKGAFVNCL